MARHLIQLTGILSLLVSLFIGSYSEYGAELSDWSTIMTESPFLLTFFPSRTELMRAYRFIGAAGLVTTFMTFSSLQTLLSWNVLVELGNISFAIYLLHIILMRIMLGGVSLDPGHLQCDFSLILSWYLCVFAASWCWNRWVEVWLGRLGDRVLDRILQQSRTCEPCSMKGIKFE